MHANDQNPDFAALAPAGHYIALRIGFAFPSEEINELPVSWVDHYTRRGFMLYDPVVKWLYENTGSIRWSEIGYEDPRGVLSDARAFGLKFGLAVCCHDPTRKGQRSFGTFVRQDREFTSEEIFTISRWLQRLHDARLPPGNLTMAELEALRMVKNGLLLKQIAAELGVSDGAVKQRLKNARLKLNAKTGTHAASLATEYGLI